MGNLSQCPECPKCAERPCYPQGAVYIWAGIFLLASLVLLILLGYACYRWGKFRGHKFGVKKGEERERRRMEAAEYTASQKAAGVANLLALTLARGGSLPSKDEERLVGGGEGSAPMIFLDNAQRQSFHGIQQVPQQGTPQQQRICQQHLESLMPPNSTGIGIGTGTHQQSVTRSSSRRYIGTGGGSGDTFII